MNTPTILFRKDIDSEAELKIASQYFRTVEHRTDCEDCFVIPRYSALPYYKELEYDLTKHGCKLINSYQQHQWIAKFKWYNVVREYTPQTWFDDNFYTTTWEGPFVVKGKTNSKKQEWNTLMFASDKRQALHISNELMKDGQIGPQGVIYRKYVPLKTFEIGLNGLPFTHEFRFFFYRKTLLSCGYYWSCAQKTDYPVPQAAISLAHKVSKIVARYVNFYVLDIAETASGQWILIEINDGSMSGLSECDANQLYNNLTTAIIPHGIYCYDPKGCCPYWDKSLQQKNQNNGYCHFLEAGDWEEEHVSLLWDMVKECNQNDSNL